MDILTLNEKIKRGEIFIDDIYQETIKKIKEDPFNAIAYERIDKALQELKETDFTNKPIKGIPMLIKNLSQELMGEHNSSSSILLKDYISSHTDSLVKRFIDLGFIIIGQTNTPEFGFDNITTSKLFGTTLSAINKHYHAGGSSGGAASAIKSGMVCAALASDGGGSIRIPASYQGLIGLKPSRGRIITGPFSHRNWQGASVHFPITKSVNDTIFFLDNLSEYLIDSPYSIPKSKVSFKDQVNLLHPKKLKIAYSYTANVGITVSKEAVAAVLDVKQTLEYLGHTLIMDTPKYDGVKLIHSYYLMNSSEAYTMIKKIKENPTFDEVEPLSYLLYQVGANVPASQYIEALNYWDEVGGIMSAFQQEYDLYLTPSTNGPAPLIANTHQAYIDQIKTVHTLPFEDQFHLLTKVFMPSLERTPFSQLANLTGQPAISLPTYKNKNNMPIGTQFIAPREREDLLLYVGKILEDEGFFI